MKKRKDILEQKLGEYNIKYAGKSKEEMKASITNLENQIEEKSNLLRKEKSKEEKEKLEAVIKKMKQEKDTISGYNKNKEKIDKIREYKNKLNEKMAPLKQEKQVLERELKQHTENNKNALEFINKTLKDSKATESMDNESYNKLLADKEAIEKERQEIQKKIDAVQKKIDTLARGASKCDLAWKSLFTDKTWDEIQARVTDGRYTRKKEVTKQEAEKISSEEKTKTDKQTKTKGTQGKEEKGLKTKSEFSEKHPKLSKFFNWAKEKFNNAKEFFKNEESQGKADKKEPSKEETNGKRDAFIEELRRNVENDKADKEAAYIEKHKVKAKTPKEAEKEEERS